MTCEEWSEVDPFELPEWLALVPVTWSCPTGRVEAGLVTGVLTSEDGGDELPCDLLAADVAYPVAPVDEKTRRRVHQAWRLGQVHLIERAGRIAIGAPGTELSSEQALEMLARFARAVGAEPTGYAVRMPVGRNRD